jgi:hypothetical protein
MTSKNHAEDYLRQYAMASRLLGEEYSPEALEEIGPALIGRDELADRIDLAPTLARLDADFGAALASASMRWRREVEKEAARGGLDRSAWWQSAIRMAGEEPAALRRAG